MAPCTGVTVMTVSFRSRPGCLARGVHRDLVGSEDGPAAPSRCRSAVSCQAARRLRVASGWTGFIWISRRISEAVMSGTMRSRLHSGKRRRRKTWCCVYATGWAGETIVA
jgi:hypothetical protein